MDVCMSQWSVKMATIGSVKLIHVKFLSWGQKKNMLVMTVSGIIWQRTYIKASGITIHMLCLKEKHSCECRGLGATWQQILLLNYSSWKKLLNAMHLNILQLESCWTLEEGVITEAVKSWLAEQENEIWTEGHERSDHRSPSWTEAPWLD